MIAYREKEVLRYLGYRRHVEELDTEAVRAMIKECGEKMNAVVSPKTTYQTFDCTVEGDTVRVADTVIHSKNLAYNLRGCHKVHMIAGTLGPDIDRLIRRAELMNVAEAAVMQALGAEMIEVVIDGLNQKLKAEAEAEGLKLKHRYSPGYGDCALHHQKDFERLLGMSRECGITLTDTYLMVPSKSVTALIGICHQGESTQ